MSESSGFPGILSSRFSPRLYLFLLSQSLLFTPHSGIHATHRKLTLFSMFFFLPHIISESQRQQSVPSTVLRAWRIDRDLLIHTAPFYPHFTNRESGIRGILHRLKVTGEDLKICLTLSNQSSGPQTSVAWEEPGRLVKTQVTGPHSRIPDSEGLGWGLWMCISDKLAGDADTAFQGPRWETLPLFGQVPSTVSTRKRGQKASQLHYLFFF